MSKRVNHNSTNSKNHNFIDYVNIKQGTLSEPRFSTGNTLPLTCVPFGMNSFSIQTSGKDGGWFYSPLHKHCEGIRLTHQPSPWVRDYGHFVIMPQNGKTFISEDNRSSSFEEISLSPAATELYFKRYSAYLGIAPSERSAVFKVRWDSVSTPRISFIPFDFYTEVNLDEKNRILTGFTNAFGDGTRSDFKFYFYITFDKPIIIEETVITHNSGETENGLCGRGKGCGISIAFNLKEGEELTALLGTSYISVENAKRNLDEVRDRSFEEVKSSAGEKWNFLLSKIKIEDTEERKQTFYSCLYRCFIFPRIFYEFDDSKNTIHYNTKTGEICRGKMFADSGFWDSYRTLYPLLSLIIPEHVGELCEGWLNFYNEQGWLPKWISPGERGIMPGTLVDAVLSDCAQKGILSENQMRTALEGMIKNATEESKSHLSGRVGVKDYLELGYIPSEKYRESVNNSLDAYFCDWCISRLAENLNETELAQKYLERSKGYKTLFDSETGFIRGLCSDGSRKSDFSPFEWGGDYCEGGAWQNGFAVYHDVKGLAELYGGNDAFEKKLDELFSSPPFFKTGTYGCEIHEMTEMANANFGQCAISNQPSMHIPYLYSAIGKIDKTAYWVRKIVNEAFSATVFPGDEDNGSMSAWYVLSVLGFYPLCPASGEYVSGVCNAKKITMTLGSGKTLSIINESSEKNIRISFNEKEIKNFHILHKDLMLGGVLKFYSEVEK